jgi:hypothetical protein
LDGQIRAVAWHRIGMALAMGREPEEADEVELTPEMMRAAMVRPMTASDLRLALAQAFADPKKSTAYQRQQTDDLVAAARARRGLR